MAKTNTAATAPKVEKFDMRAFLPEGFSESDFDVIGGLRPICQPETMMKYPVCGYVVALLDMPQRKDKSDWRALLIHLTGATKAKAGEDIVEVAAGEEVLVPINGNLKNNPDLLNAACDPRNVYIAWLQCVGQLDVGKASDMWNFEVKLSRKSIQRQGRYALQQHNQVGVVKDIPQLGKGDITDANGKPQQSMVG